MSRGLLREAPVVMPCGALVNTFDEASDHASACRICASQTTSAGGSEDE